MKKILIYLIISVISIAFFSFKKKSIKLETPPGTYQLDSNFFADVNEIRNVDYREYVYWNERVFGKKAAEYLNTLPDSTVWDNENIEKGFGDKYFRHPAYQEYPVLGVSYKQAVEFCKWRSERVNEMILVREGELLWNMKQTKDNYFTIAKFVSGKYVNYKDDNQTKPINSKYQFVEYTLPTEKEWNYILKKSEELFYKKKISKGKLKKNSTALRNGKAVPFIWSASSVKYFSNKSIQKPIGEVFITVFKQKFNGLQGNVAEITANNSIIGGSWKDTEAKILENKQVKYEKPTNYIGFRCAAKWHEYNIE